MLGPRAALLNLHFHYLGFDSTHVIAINGIGQPVGTFRYNHSLDFGTVSRCAFADSVVTFFNSTCQQVLVDSLLVKAPFTLLDSSSLPYWVDPAKTTSFRVRYRPSGALQETGHVVLVLLLNGEMVYDTLALSGTGIHGSSSFVSSLATGSIPFAPRSECDRLDSLTFSMSNPGCDSLTIVSAVLEGNANSEFSMTIDRPLPRTMLGTDSVSITVSLVKLTAGSFSGSVHIHYLLADGTGRDTLIPVSALIKPGTRTLVLATPPGTPLSTSGIDFGTFNACATRDTAIIYTNTGCLPLTISRMALAGVGFLLSPATADSIVVAPGQTDTLHISFDGQHTGNLASPLLIHSNADANALISIPILGYVPPLDSAGFILATSTTTIKPGDTFEVTITPDRAISNKKLFSIAGSLAYFEDNYDLVSITPMAGLDTQISRLPATGKIAHLHYNLSSATDISLAPASPILTAKFVSRLSDSIAAMPWSVEAFQLNGGDPDYSRCTLASTVKNSPTIATLSLACGDSLIAHTMAGVLVFRVEPARPNPVTSQARGYSTTLELHAEMDGTADVEVFDALGRSVAKTNVALAQGTTEPCRLDFTQLPGGSYFYSVRFHSAIGDARSRGSLLLLR